MRLQEFQKYQSINVEFKVLFSRVYRFFAKNSQQKFERLINQIGLSVFDVETFQLR